MIDIRLFYRNMCQSAVKSVMSLFKFIKGGFWLPIVIPLFLYQLIFSWHLRSAKRLKLQDKVVLITGASSGLGEALAHVFYNAGCKVILAARRRNELERVKGALLASNTQVLSHHPVILTLDLSDLKTIADKALEAINVHGTVDILVNNSGISSRGDAVTTSLDVDIKLMVVNYFGHIALTKAVLNTMIQKRHGHIVAISSVQGKIALPHRSSYAASKHALGAFFDSLRAELSDQNISVTVVNPGYLKTNLSVNAVKADGSTYGVMDSATASGTSSSAAAERILEAIVRGEHEVYICTLTNKIAVYLRTIIPSLYFYIMAKRAKKTN